MATVEQQAQELACVLIPQHRVPLLLPNVAVAEVLRWHALRAVRGVPPWMLGLFAWRGQVLPVLSVETLIADEASAPANGPEACLVVLNRVGSQDRLRFYAIVAQGSPRLMRLTEEDLDNDPEVAWPGERVRVRVGEETAVIPDLSAIENTIVERGLIPRRRS